MSYLLHLSLGAPQSALLKRIVKSAVCFLETKAPVEGTLVGVYERTSRSAKRAETLYVVSLTFPGGSEPGGADLGRKLEGILRSTLGESGAEGSEIKVYAASEEPRG